MRNVIVPIYDLSRGTSRFKYGRILQKTQWLPLQEIKKLQNKNLRALVKHAYSTVPYYNRIFRQKNLHPDDITSVDDLVKLPILSKDNIRANFGDLISRKYDKKKMIPYTSGGSGDQLRFYVTGDQLSWEIAAEYRAYDWADYRLGDSCFLFWGSPIDLSKYKSLERCIARRLENVTIVDSFVLSNEALLKTAMSLKKNKPKVIRGYASSVYLMAKYLVENNLDFVRPKTVIATAETLSASMKEMIEKAFACPVFDYYGSREIGSLAAQCEERSNYHISAENVALEFVKDDEQVGTDEKGLVLLTSLRNFGMPLIRYKIGDIGVPTDEVCNCGRGLPLMRKIQGRISDFLAIRDEKNGNIVPIGPVYIIVNNALLQMPLKSIRIFQESLDKISINVVIDKNFSEEDINRLLIYMRNYLGSTIQIAVKIVDSLESLPSGKHPTFISKIDAFSS